MNFSKNIRWSPIAYKSAAVVAEEAAIELMTRLEWMTLIPERIVDVGCGLGHLSGLLQKRYPEAQVISVDLSMEMLDYAKQHASCICAEAGTLPFQNDSVNIIVANFLLPWHGDHARVLHEWQRVLAPDGLIIFTMLGPDTMQEWHAYCEHSQRPVLVDVHEVGDLLIQEKFREPVLEVNHYTVHYQKASKLLAELTASGMLDGDMQIEKGMDLSVTYEVIHAHAFASSAKEGYGADEEGVARIPLSAIRRSNQ